MKKYQAIYDKVSEMISDAKDMELSMLTPDTILAQLELDSLDYVELMILSKREFNITLNAELFTQHPLMTLDELCRAIHKEMAD
ncbi:acyl carrier protein [Citrobacter koseri]|uniref:acyl carrier protein n=1 Tax=Citrobacter koseri TaxID=545 RepID=UPI00066672BE|nr:phosphopantetheine-binding protein [Citrobacter koseri]HEM6801124.1 acyl carrier protein [Citrobacter koseri]